MAGAAGVAVSLGLTELFAGWSTAVPSAISAIGGFVVDLSPSWLKTFAISTFGTADKAVLAICIVGVALLIGWFVGKASAQRPYPMVIAFAAAAVVGIAETRVVGLELDNMSGHPASVEISIEKKTMPR